MKGRIIIELFSDYICPWCYLGKLRLIRVLNTSILKNEIKIIHLPVQLYPSIPPGGVKKEVFSNRIKPGMGRALRAESKLEDAEINYSKIQTIPNSFEAHRLAYLARNEENIDLLILNIFQKYFEEGVDIGSHSNLRQIALESSISSGIIHNFNNTKNGKKETLDLIDGAGEAGVTLVPTIRLNNIINIPGLQEFETYHNYVKRIDSKV